MTGKTCCSPSRPTADPIAAAGPHRRHDHGATVTGLVPLAGGEFVMGTDDRKGYVADGEGPAHLVALSPFAISATTVTNDEFSGFVAATGYRTTAERHGTSFVFAGLLPDDHPPTRAVADAPWWREVEGADWSHPEGPASGVASRGDHPVVHISWSDAVAFCGWAGVRLPTEAEWEFAARGGRRGAHFPWGHEREPGGVHLMNVFQGRFPSHDNGADGWAGTCPVQTFPPNGFGLYEMTGNVWEWCADWFSPHAYLHSAIHDPVGPSTGERRVMRGGSYLCHASHCRRYRVDARSSSTPHSSAGNVGFRVCAMTLNDHDGVQLEAARPR